MHREDRPNAREAPGEGPNGHHGSARDEPPAAESAAPRRRRTSLGGPIVVIGMPGSGKTTVGRRLARVLDVDFVDTDQLIEADQGVPIPEIFASRGEPYFREVEERIVAAAVHAEDGVVSLGGGAIISAATRALLAGHTVVHLTIGVAEGARRSRGGHRPLLAHSDVLAKYQELHTDRAPLYREVATVAVSTERRSTGKVIRDLVESLDPELAATLDIDTAAAEEHPGGAGHNGGHAHSG